VISPAPGADLFTNGAIHQLRIDIDPADVARLRREPGEFVRATVRESGEVYAPVAVRLRGSVGSFRPVDDKPGLTLEFQRFNGSRRFHGLRRIHLNNSVEDPSYCHEQIGSEVFRAAGVPAARVAHAVVVLNGRRLGLYVLKEGLTEDFLACHFKQVGGNLYEPGAGHDVNQRLKRNSLPAPRHDRTALKALAAAALEPDPGQRWQGLERALEVDRFVAFMAVEVMLGHRDGYCLARNNFRVYEDFDTGAIVFFPHGMDQLLGRPDLPWQPHMAGLVAKAVMETPEGRQRYRECFTRLFANLFQPEALTRRVDQLPVQLRPWLNPAELRSLANEIASLRERIVQRQQHLAGQLSQPEPAPLAFTNGVALLGRWVKVDEPVGGTMDESFEADGTPVLSITAGAETAASWRSTALLGPGRYLFEGRARISGVRPLPYGAHQGAGLRVGGAVRQSLNFTGDSTWRRLEAGFEMDNPASEVEFICELRASAGEAWFDRGSLRVRRLP